MRRTAAGASRTRGRRERARQRGVAGEVIPVTLNQFCGVMRLSVLVPGYGHPFFLVPAILHPAFTWGERMTDKEQKPQKPPWVRPRIIAAPKIRQIYWCDFWQDAHLPEMWKTRPVIVISYTNTLHGPCLVIPTTTEPDNESNPWACKLSIKIDGTPDSWTVCHHPS